MNTQSKGIVVKQERTELTAPHLDSSLSFVYPPAGPDMFYAVRQQLSERKLLLPTMAQNVSLVHAAWQNPKEKYSAEVIDI